MLMKTRFLQLLLLAAFLCGALAPAARAANYTWQGGVPPPTVLYAWNIWTNWSPLAPVGVGPGLADDAIFPAGLIPADSQVILTAPASINSLTFNVTANFILGVPGVNPLLTLSGTSAVINNSSQNTLIHPDLDCGPGSVFPVLRLGGTGSGQVRFLGNILNQPNVVVDGANFFMDNTAPSLTLDSLNVNPGGWLEIAVLNPVTVPASVVNVNGGTLRLCNPASVVGGIFSAPLGVNITGGGTINASGFVQAGTLTVGGSSGFSVGCSPGTLFFTGNLIFGPGITLTNELNTPNIVGGKIGRAHV